MLITELLAPVQLGDDLQVDVLDSCSYTLDSEVTENPTELGFNVADHVINKQTVLSLTALFTPYPVTWYQLQKDKLETRIEDVKREIKRIHDTKEPITVKTHDAIYDNMIMTKAPIAITKENGNSLLVEFEFKQVVRVQANTADVPPEYAQQDEKIIAQVTQTDASAGTATTTEIGTGGTGSTNTSVTGGDTFYTGAEQTANVASNSLSSSMGG